MVAEQKPAVVGHTENSVFVEAGIEQLWELTNDVTTWPDLFTEYASVEVLEEQGDTVRFRLSMHPDESGTVWSWVSERTVDRAAHTVAARRVEPGPFEYMNIRWSYATEGNGTRMRWVQDFRMRPGAPLDDAAMTERINANSVIQMDVIRQKVEQAVHRPRRDVTIRHGTSPVTAHGPVSRHDMPVNRRRGGDIRTLLSPVTVGAEAGFMGTLTLEPGEVVTEHWHPYSEEFLYCVRGEITLLVDGEKQQLRADEAVHLPIGVRHRLVNDGPESAFFVFCLGPLAPRPELGHVDTEPLPAGTAT